MVFLREKIAGFLPFSSLFLLSVFFSFFVILVAVNNFFTKKTIVFWVAEFSWCFLVAEISFLFFSFFGAFVILSVSANPSKEKKNLPDLKIQKKKNQLNDKEY